MATSSILGGDRVPAAPSGSDMASLGPSDLSDSGSDLVGAYGPDELAGDSDSAGTGERASAVPDFSVAGADILPDHAEALDLDESTDTSFALDQAEAAAEATFDQDLDQDLEPARADGLTASEAARDRPELIDTPADVRALAVDEEPAADDAALDEGEG